MTRAERISIFCRELQQWFSRHKRALPWRDLTEKNADHRAYLVLVSEVMLQQTQVSRVIILYKNFLEKYPRIEDLAKATNAEVITAWRGLGYNNRAIRLRDTAREIVARSSLARDSLRTTKQATSNESTRNVFPTRMEELMSLPGIGHYTAAAVRNFAFDLPTVCIDVNVRRIVHRFFIGPENADGTWKASDKELTSLVESLMKRAGELGFKAKDFYAALMDFGSLVCSKNAPKWELLSLNIKSICKAYGSQIKRTKNMNKKEKGREVAGRHIPNRIFRGRVVEALRDHPKGLTLDAIGRIITPDWTMGDHTKWLAALIGGLQENGIVEKHSRIFRLQG